MTDEIDYVALCEGDDYWTDKHKLQKQADALDANPQATLVYTNFQTIDAEGNPIIRPFIKDFPGRSHSGDNLPTLLRYGNYIMVLTSMYRYKVFESEFLTNCPVRMDFNTTMCAATGERNHTIRPAERCFGLGAGYLPLLCRIGDEWARQAVVIRSAHSLHDSYPHKRA